MQDGKINPAFCFYIADDSLFSCRTLRGVTFRPRKVTKSRRGGQRPQAIRHERFYRLDTLLGDTRQKLLTAPNCNQQSGCNLERRSSEIAKQSRPA